MTEMERLDKIEDKIDTLVEAMTQMVKFEEKIATHQAGMERFGFRMDDMEQRVEAIEKRTPIYDMWSGWANRLTFAVIITLLGAVLGLVII